MKKQQILFVENDDMLASLLNYRLKKDDYNLVSKNIEEEELEDDYVTMNYEEKDAYLDIIEENVSVDKIEFLEQIMESEQQSELRFKAFKRLKQLKTIFPVKRIIEKEQAILKEEESPVIINNKTLSIFHPLYQKTNDLDSKLILIELMGLLGNEKEIDFLKTIINSDEPKICKLTKKTIKFLENKHPENDSETIDKIPEQAIKEKEENKFSKTLIPSDFSREEEKENRLPLDLCFLYDEFGIEAPKQEDNDFDFELSKEFFNLNNNKEKI